MPRSASNQETTWQKTICWVKRRQSQHLRHRYQRELYVVAICGLAAFYYAAIASFHPSDPSPLAISFPPKDVQNLAGALGAGLSSISFFILGLGAYFLPLPFLLTAILLFLDIPKSFSKTRLFGLILGFMSLTTLFSLYIKQFNILGFTLPAGGLIGENLSTFLRGMVGEIGAIIALCTSVLVSLIATTRKGVLRDSLLYLARMAKTLPWRLPKWPTKKPASALVSAPPAAASQEFLPPLFTRELLTADESLAPHFEPSLPLEPLNRKPSLPLDASFSETSKPAYSPPPASIFRTSAALGPISAKDKEEYEQTAAQLTQAFSDFSINGQVVAIQPGPVVTVFEFEADAGIKLSRILGLVDDIALALKVDAVLMTPVSGKSAIGVQVPNKNRVTVYLGDIVNTETFRRQQSPMTLAMGKSLTGDPVCADLCTMPHLLMAGATGAGKSVAINALLCSVILKSTPDEVRMILVDPKMLELSMYEDIPHLMMPVITDAKKASSALRWATFEMERRYRLMQLAKVRHIHGFNQFWQTASEDAKDEIRMTLEDEDITTLPFILLVIDELADLMLTAPKDVESSIQRLAQKARASGIHLVLATQRPSVDIITGVIKANLPCRVAFQTVSKHDSRTILDQVGSEKLLGKGDMLFLKPGTSRLERIQGAFIEDHEVITLVETLKAGGQVKYDEKVINWIDKESEKGDATGLDLDPGECDDAKFDEAVSIAVRHGAISASFLQRQLKIGYNRAARIVEAMAAQGMVGEADGAKPRKWLGPRNEVSDGY